LSKIKQLQDALQSALEKAEDAQARNIIEKALSDTALAIAFIEKLSHSEVDASFLELMDELRFVSTQFDEDEWNVRTVIEKTGEQISAIWNAEEVAKEILREPANQYPQHDSYTNQLAAIVAKTAFTLQLDLRLGFTQINQKSYGNLPTPSGAPTKLSPALQGIVRSPKFISWFGDWQGAYKSKDYSGVSKAIDKDTGEPEILFHGTSYEKQPFTSFKVGYFKVPAIYLTPSYENAKAYADANKLRGDRKAASASSTEYVYEAFVSLKNPIDMRFLGTVEMTYEQFSDILYILTGFDLQQQKVQLNFAAGQKVSTWVLFDKNPDLIKTLRNLGEFDGLMYVDVNPDYRPDGVPFVAVETVVFYSNKVKSINAQFFSAAVDDIRFEKGGLV